MKPLTATLKTKIEQFTLGLVNSAHKDSPGISERTRILFTIPVITATSAGIRIAFVITHSPYYGRHDATFHTVNSSLFAVWMGAIPT